jgi:hypothetical protein
MIHQGLRQNNIPPELRRMILDQVPFTTSQYIDFCLPLDQRPTPGWTADEAKSDCTRFPPKLEQVDLKEVTRYLRSRMRLRYQLDTQEEYNQLCVELSDILGALHKYTLAITPAHNENQLNETGYLQFVEALLLCGIFKFDTDLVRTWIEARQCSPIRWAAKYIQHTNLSVLNMPREWMDELPSVVELGLKNELYCVVILAQRFLQKINGRTISVFSLQEQVPFFFRGLAADAFVYEYINTMLEEIITPDSAYLDDMDPDQIMDIIKDTQNTTDVGAMLGVCCLTAYQYQQNIPDMDTVVNIVQYTLTERQLDEYALLCLQVFVWMQHALLPARRFFNDDNPDLMSTLYRPGDTDYVKRVWYKMSGKKL